MIAVLELFSSVFSLSKIKVTISKNVNFTDHMSGIQRPDCFKLAINPKSDNDVIIC